MRTLRVKVSAGLFTAAILGLGYFGFGFWVSVIFSSGFLTGYLLWLCFAEQPHFNDLKVPFWATFVVFILHRIEEKVMGFFPALSAITGVPTPEITSWKVILLVVGSVGGWLLIPSLVKRRHPFGYYLAWTFFSAMGITELAHFVFPFFKPGDYAYFPGMWSVVGLVPLAAWGIGRLVQSAHDD